jgi:undecaprenyl pyrophosphate synthase
MWWTFFSIRSRFLCNFYGRSKIRFKCKSVTIYDYSSINWRRYSLCSKVIVSYKGIKNLNYLRYGGAMR